MFKVQGQMSKGKGQGSNSNLQTQTLTHKPFRGQNYSYLHKTL